MVIVMSQWYYQLLGEEFGPISLEALQELIAQGTLSQSDQIREESSDEWQVAAEALENALAREDDVFEDLLADMDEIFSRVEASAENRGDHQIAQSLSDIEFVLDDGRSAAGTEPGDTDSGTATAVAESPVDRPQRRGRRSPARPVPPAVGTGGRDDDDLASEALFSEDDDGTADEYLSRQRSISAPGPYRPKLQTRSLSETIRDSQPATESPQQSAVKTRAQKSAFENAVTGALQDTKRRAEGKVFPDTMRKRMKAVLLVILVSVLGIIQFRSSFSAYFRDHLERCATRTEMAITALEAVDPLTQQVTWSSQVQAIGRELGFYKQVLEQENEDSERARACLGALTNLVELSRLEVHQTQEQHALLEAAKQHLAAFRAN